MKFTGERFIPGIEADFAAEHLHRYLLANKLVAGKDVLDIASGEGYGSALLAKTAATVYGVDISLEAVLYARKKYVAPHLSYLQGTAAEIPLPNNSVDVVVSFETLEHHDQHHKMMREILRVLRHDGLLCLSSPERAMNADLPETNNPYHIKELTRVELETLIEGYFSHYSIMEQRSIFGSCICGEAGMLHSWRWRGDKTEEQACLFNPKFYLLLATNSPQPLPEFAPSIFENSPLHSEESLAQRYALEQKNETLAQYAAEQEQYAQYLLSELETIRRSRSWRITLPLRRCTAFFRRMTQCSAVQLTYKRLHRVKSLVLKAVLLLCCAPAIYIVSGGFRQGYRAARTAQKTLSSLLVNSQQTHVVIRKNHGFLLRYAALSGLNISEWLAHMIKFPLSTPISSAPRHVKVAFISGEPDSFGGHAYRVERMAQAVAHEYDVAIYRLDAIASQATAIVHADVLWIWRAAITPDLSEALRRIKAQGKAVIFDVDDLCYDPKYCLAKYMDAIRARNISIQDSSAYAANMLETLRQADMVITTTKPLADTIATEAFWGSVRIIPNGFDRESFLISRDAVERKSTAFDDTLIRIGYAAGTATHQADFAVIAPALMEVLPRHPEVRLVLFSGKSNLLEFPDLLRHQHQVEWRTPVSLDKLPYELVRFDINIAPLEANNIFCDCKSELKFFEAALVGVPTIASPTPPYADAIRHGENGLLASSTADWIDALESLIASKDYRNRMAETAFNDIFWFFGPERRMLLALNALRALFGDRQTHAHDFLAEQCWSKKERLPIATGEYTVIYSTGKPKNKVSVVIPLYNYEQYIIEALQSLYEQTYIDFDIIVVDDASTDKSCHIAKSWLENNSKRFSSVSLLGHKKNYKLSITRNTGIEFSSSEYVMLLDADNRLLPQCLELCALALDTSSAAIAFTSIKKFGDEDLLISQYQWLPEKLQVGNYIDAMVMLRKACWNFVGGFTHMDLGWEDYDMWCKMVEAGFWGKQIPEVAAEYRVHKTSMLHTVTDKKSAHQQLIQDMRKRHPWIRVQ